MDFGLAKLKDAPTITQTSSPMGTVGYMSPELILGEPVDHRTDLWSLGVVFFEMLTGELPFKGDSDVSTLYAIIGDGMPKLTTYNPAIPGSLQYICETVLEKDPKMRYQNTDDVLVFFDTTLIYFEGQGGDTIGNKGHSKDHRPDLMENGCSRPTPVYRQRKLHSNTKSSGWWNRYSEMSSQYWKPGLSSTNGTKQSEAMCSAVSWL